MLAIVNVSDRGCAGSRLDWHADRRQPDGNSTRYASPRLVYTPGPAVGLGRSVAGAVVATGGVVLLALGAMPGLSACDPHAAARHTTTTRTRTARGAAGCVPTRGTS